MPYSRTRNININLSDYSFRQDIEQRLLISQLSLFEVKVLHEITYHSTTISIDQLAKELSVNSTTLFPVLEKLSKTKLFKIQHTKLIVDKDVRKNFEFQLEKFDEEFKPDLNFLQNLLNQVPIHILPTWYVISHSSDNIIASIVDKYLATPKIFRNHLNEIQMDNPILAAIINDVYLSPNLELKASEIISKHQLTRSYFEECVLLLEYHFACCLTYKQANNQWEEVVKPFAEWSEYLRFENQRVILPKNAKIKVLSVQKKEKPPKLNLSDFDSLPEDYPSQFATLWNRRNLQLIEKSLKNLKADEWVEFYSYLRGLSAPIGDNLPVCLKNRGKKWAYTIPDYTDLEKEFIEIVIMKWMEKRGIVSIGVHNEKICFCLTFYGAQYLH